MALVLPLRELRETEQLGAALAAVAQRGAVIFLTGDLGAGKTALARGFLRHYFLNPDLDVPSPSYLLHFTYTDEGEEAAVAADGCAAASLSAEDTVAGSTHGRDFRGGRFATLPGVAVHHLDPYRLPEGRIAGLVEFEKMFASDISLIEWPERLGEQLVTAISPARLELTLGLCLSISLCLSLCLCVSVCVSVSLSLSLSLSDSLSDTHTLSDSLSLSLSSS